MQVGGTKHFSGASWLSLIMLCLQPFDALIRALAMPLVFSIRRLRVDLILKVLAVSVVPVFIMATRRLVYTDYGSGVIVDLAAWLVIALFLTGTKIDAKVADRVLNFLFFTFFLNYALLPIFDNPLLWYWIYGGDASDLTVGLFFRNPGVFNEPSTYCYIVLAVFLFSSQRAVHSWLLAVTCIMSTSFGGILALICVLILLLKWRQILVSGITAALGLYIFMFFFEEGGYYGERLAKIVDGSDGSAAGRLSTFAQIQLTVIGMDIASIKDLYTISTVKSVGFLSNVFINLGIMGIAWLSAIVILVRQHNVLARIALLSFMKFDVFSAPAWVLLLCVRARAKE